MTYAASKVPPSNQFVSPSLEIAIVKKTAVIIDTSSGMVNTKGILCAKNIDSNTNTGATNMAICNVEPIAISTAIFTLFLYKP